MYDYARDTRSEQKMLEDFRVGKENEELCTQEICKELVWKGNNINKADFLLNELDEPGQFKKYQPDAIIKIEILKLDFLWMFFGSNK